MTQFAVGMVIGLFVGGMSGVVAMALCVTAGESDERRGLK